MPEIAAIILAAGRSQRFGGDKLAAPLTLGDTRLPLLAHTLRPWLQVFERVQVVVRSDHAALSEAVMQGVPGGRDRIAWIICPEADAGMGRSLATGVAATPAAAGWLIGLGDMPNLAAEVITAVKSSIEAGAALAAPFVQDQRGHPVGFSSQFRGDLLALQGDAGARELLLREHHRLTRIPVHETGILFDIDTPSDLSHLIESER